jgi:G3E family GTPase
MSDPVSAFAKDPSELRLPVTIITGFLGSGKTTLLNHILNQRAVRTAVIINELGDIGIDNELIVSAGEDMVELSNGCICCSINNDLVDAVFRVLNFDSKIDYLVVETTGVADPLPVVLTFLRSEFRDLVRIDSIITIADAENFCLDLFESRAARNQLLYGDVILLNKCDLVGMDRLQALEETIRTIKNGAQIVRTTRCQVSLPLILGVGRFQPDQYFADRGHSGGRNERDEPDHDREASHEHGHGHLTADGFASLSFQSDRAFAVHRFQDFLNQLPDTVFRAKGLLWIDESDRRYIFHLVGRRFSLDESPPGGSAENKLVLIGRNLDPTQLRQQLESCLTAH